MPPPDKLEEAFTNTPSCLLTDDGSPITTQLTQSLIERGWQVTVLRFPQLIIPNVLDLPPNVSQITLQDWSEEHLQQQLSNLALTETTSLDAFIHLHPVYLAEHRAGIHFQDNEYNIVKQVFLLAKHLKKLLQQAEQKRRSAFLSVVRLDGTFGLKGQANFSPLGGGLFGLTKCLNHEWKSVFCRGIDLSPCIEAEQAVQNILAELYDPNRTLEDVGYSSRGRTTLVTGDSW